MSQSPELVIDGAVATITLRRPKQANRLTPDDLATLVDHVAQVNGTPEVLVLQLRGEGKYFCSGADLTSMGGARPMPFEDVVNAVEDARPVTVAVLHGSVYGGGTDLAIACDFRVGVHGIDMFMPAARLGLHFYQRGLERFLSRVGLNETKRLFFTAETVGADHMKASGYLTHLVGPDELDGTVKQLSSACASMAPLALLGTKRHLNLLARGAVDPAALKADMVAAARSADLREGLAAWAEKRAPKFTGR